MIGWQDIDPYVLMALAIPLTAALWPFGRDKQPDESAEQPAEEAGQPEPVIDHVDWGIRLGMLGRFERAVERFEAAVKKDPEDACAHYNLALALDQAGEHARAKDAFERACSIRPHPDTNIGLGIVQMGLRNLKAAELSFRKAVEMDPGDPIARFDLGCLLMEQGDWEQAIAELRAAADADPKDAQVRFNLAFAFRHVGKPGDAEREFRDFLALARGRFPEQQEFAMRLLGEGFETTGGRNAL